MADFGRHWGFYNRQLKTFNKLSADQAAVKDEETGEEVGVLPHYDDIAEFFGDESTQPEDRSTFVHGDYKVDNVVFHPTEPRVIGILDWEMVSRYQNPKQHIIVARPNPSSQATIGHPLSDICNLIAPFTTASHPMALRAGRRNLSFLDGATEGLPTKSQCIEWYESVLGYSVNRRELLWAEAFGIYRGAVIMQGIKARYAQRQASSEKAMVYGAAMGPQAEMAWQFVQEVKKKNEEARAQGKGWMLGKATTVNEWSAQGNRAEGKGYIVEQPKRKTVHKRGPDEKAAEGKGYMIGRPEKL
jgi:aminoglycoside phosphotransferase (APT) family kinase protein